MKQQAPPIFIKDILKIRGGDDDIPLCSFIGHLMKKCR